MTIVAESRALAAELGVLDRSVFFNASWVDYRDRHNYLAEAEAGVSTHFAHVETTFSFRTRILDYLWAGLPMVVTAGDHFADLVDAEGLGVVVPPNDVEALTAALDMAMFDEAFRVEAKQNIRRVRERYAWDVVLDPLVEFAESPRRARDLAGSATSVGAATRKRTMPPRKRHGLLHDMDLAVHYLRTGGPRVLIQGPEPAPVEAPLSAPAEAQASTAVSGAPRGAWRGGAPATTAGCSPDPTVCRRSACSSRCRCSWPSWAPSWSAFRSTAPRRGPSTQNWQEGRDPDLLAGTPQLIRTDEWNVQTVWAIAQAEQGLPVENQTFPGGMDATIPQDLPRADWSVAFRPHLLGFLAWDVDHAIALKWWLPGLSLIAAAYCSP